MISIFISRSDNSLHDVTLDDLPAQLAVTKRTEQVLWVDMSSPTEEEEDRILGEIFKFHHLAIADVRHEHTDARHGDHLPKVEDYGSYLFSIINPIDIGEQSESSGRSTLIDIKTRQINVFLGESYIVTHHYEPSQAIIDATTMCKKNPILFTRGPDYIYNLILDDIVNSFSPLLDRFDEAIEKLEDDVFHRNASNRTLAAIIAMKRTVFRMRRIMMYQREMVHRLSRGEFSLVTIEEIAYYRNVYDHLERAADLAESYRDVLMGLLEAYLSMASNRLNEVVKVLTILSTFFLPLTFIAGVYGMNFEHMPELEWKYGYLFAWGLMVAVAVTMYLFFRRRGWL
jgi:magnesium transporter